MNIEAIKEKVGVKAFNDLIPLIEESHIIGLGTGSTVKYFILELLRNRLYRGKIFVVSSIDTLLFVKKYSKDLCLADISSVETVDIYVDGADEVSSNLDLIKGRGAAFLREKMIALRAEYRVYLVDYSKYNGKNYLYKKPVPVEVTIHALPWILEKLSLNDQFKPIIRMGKAKDGPIISDNGNIIIDLYPLKPIERPDEIDKKLRLINGVIETGIFPRDLVDKVYIGYEDKITVLTGTR